MAAVSNYTLSGNFDFASAVLHFFVQDAAKEKCKTAMVAAGHMAANQTYDEQIDQLDSQTQELCKRVVLF
jgi:hypothetical protein